MAAALELQPSTNVRDMVDCVREAAERFHIVSLNRQIEVCEGLLSRNPLIDVAILGQFKAGKSSFINSLTGRDILPVGVIPVTTVVTRLSYGEPERATVVFLDGTRTEVGIEALGEYISEARNPPTRSRCPWWTSSCRPCRGTRDCAWWTRPAWEASSPTTRRSRRTGSPRWAPPSWQSAPTAPCPRTTLTSSRTCPTTPRGS